MQFFDFKKIFGYLMKWVMLGMAVTALAGCGMNAEVQDLKNITQSFQQAGFSPNTQNEIQQKLLAAKTPEEQKVLIKEMKDLFQKASDALKQTDTKSKEGTNVRDSLKTAFQHAADLMEKSLSTDEKDKEAMLKLQVESAQMQKEMMMAMGEFIALAKKHGVEMNP